ncbi:retroviral-like aspartic protease family protein [Candidatus Uhrbacteria bacterium]|nr:retroviral-like aspartic protease family protein [Candidatus Uhrbacteria bacterium]
MKPDLRQSGPTIEVYVSPSLALRTELEKNAETFTKRVKKIFLIDTGASSTLMKTGVAEELGLIPKGQIGVHTPTSQNFSCYTYDIDLILPNHIVFQNLFVCEAPLSGQNIDGLLGRDILERGIFIYTGYANQFTLAT